MTPTAYCHLHRQILNQMMNYRNRRIHFCHLKNADRIKNDGIAISSENKIKKIERLINNSRPLRNITDANPLRQNDD